MAEERSPGLWDRVERAEHDFTMMAGPLVGRTIYYCERCASLLFVSGGDDPEVFHAPPPGASEKATIDVCPGRRTALAGPTLKARLDEMRECDYERLKAI